MPNMYSKPPNIDRDGRGPSRDLWKNCPREEIMLDSNIGYCYRDDFLDLPTGKYTLSDLPSGGGNSTSVLSDSIGGSILLSVISTDDLDAFNFQTGSTVGEFIAIGTDVNCWFETRLKMTAVATNGMFVGLSAIDTTLLIADSLISSPDYIGFHSVEHADGDIVGIAENAGTTTSSTALVDAPTFANTYKLGFHTTGVSKIEWFVNGKKVVPTTNITASTSIPDGTLMVPTFAATTVGTTAPILEVDWFEVFVEDRRAATAL